MRTEISRPPPPDWMPLRRLGVRRLTRAHLALQRRPGLAELARAAVQRVAAAFSQQLGCEVAAEVRLVPFTVVPANELGALSAFAVFELSSVGAKVVLEAELPQVVALVERLCGARASQGPVFELTRLEEGAFGFLALLAVSAVRGEAEFERLFAPRLIGVQGERSLVARELGDSAHLGFELSLQVGENPVRARLYAAAEAVETAIQALAPASGGPIPEPIARSGLHLRCRAGHCELDAATLEALAPGDVVLFEGLRFETGQLWGAACLSSRLFQLAGQFDARGFQFTRGERRIPQEPSMSVDAPSQLPVEIEVELTRVSVPISELSTLEPGAVLPLHMNVSKPVFLRVGDRVVAKAELVDIEGEVGARILALCP